MCLLAAPLPRGRQRFGAALGFAYAAPYRSRAAYRFSVEDSVYGAPRAVGRGIGRTLLGALVARCGDAGYRQIVGGNRG